MHTKYVATEVMQDIEGFVKGISNEEWKNLDANNLVMMLDEELAKYNEDPYEQLCDYLVSIRLSAMALEYRTCRSMADIMNEM